MEKSKNSFGGNTISKKAEYQKETFTLPFFSLFFYQMMILLRLHLIIKAGNEFTEM